MLYNILTTRRTPTHPIDKLVTTIHRSRTCAQHNQACYNATKVTMPLIKKHSLQIEITVATCHNITRLSLHCKIELVRK